MNNNNSNLLTDSFFWSKYWEYYQPKVINKIFFSSLIPKLNFKKGQTLIEIGGFPGRYAVYFKKYYGLDVTVLDYHINKNILNELIKMNGLPKNSINIIDADFTKYKSKNKYDIVCSFGFIEHFVNTKDILKRHIDLLKDGGLLFINVPNFRGINGYIQKYFDKNNYASHNLEFMKIKNIKRFCDQLKLKDYRVYYYGKPNVWLEPNANVTRFTKFFVGYMGKILRRIPINNSFLSPFIFLQARKS